MFLEHCDRVDEETDRLSLPAHWENEVLGISTPVSKFMIANQGKLFMKQIFSLYSLRTEFTD